MGLQEDSVLMALIEQEDTPTPPEKKQKRRSSNRVEEREDERPERALVYTSIVDLQQRTVHAVCFLVVKYKKAAFSEITVTETRLQSIITRKSGAVSEPGPMEKCTRENTRKRANESLWRWWKSPRTSTISPACLSPSFEKLTSWNSSNMRISSVLLRFSFCFY